MTLGVKYISYPDHSGYGLSALAYVRALHNAGVPVWWAPLIVSRGSHTIWQESNGLEQLPVALGSEADASLCDIPAITRACGPKSYDTVITHILPEHWATWIEPGKRNIGYTVWETDILPKHWPPLLAQADKILVPSLMNQALFDSADLGKSVSAIPHIRRHAWNNIAPGDKAGLRRQLGIPDDHFIFYSINVWDPRKALPDLVTTFGHTFSGHDRVSLVLKTSTVINGLCKEGGGGNVNERVQQLLRRASEETGRPPPKVVVSAVDGLPGRVIDTLHALGDCFISLTHGEGWGMGAFDAASVGKPVLITGYGGPEEYLGVDYPGLLPYEMETVSGWVEGTSFAPPQQWACPNLTAASRLMRRMVTHYSEFMDAASLVTERIANLYSEPVVASQLLAELQ